MNNSGKWVCVRDPAKCHGRIFRAGRSVSCPLLGYCAAEKLLGRKWAYEYKATICHNVMLELGVAEPGDNYERAKKRKEYIKLFAPDLYEDMRRKECQRVQRYYRDNREAVLAKKRQRYAVEHPPQSPDPRPTLPCGEDCENCPYETCRYPDKDGDILYDEFIAQKNRIKINARKREWRKNNPEKHAAAARRYRASHKEQHRSKQREYNRRYRQNMSDAQREQEREKYRRYRESHREEINARQRERRKNKAKEV